MKTIRLDAIKANANAIFRDSVNDYAAQRRAVQYFVADLLMRADAYRGFRYLEASELEPGKSIGLIRNSDNPAGPHAFPDDSRVAFL